MTAYYGHIVWTDEDGEMYFLEGHVPARRAIAAVNRYCRKECGFINLSDEHGAPLSFVTVRHTYWRHEPLPGWQEHSVLTTAGDLWGKPFTEVSV